MNEVVRPRISLGSHALQESPHLRHDRNLAVEAVFGPTFAISAASLAFDPNYAGFQINIAPTQCRRFPYPAPRIRKEFDEVSSCFGFALILGEFGRVAFVARCGLRAAFPDGVDQGEKLFLRWNVNFLSNEFSWSALRPFDAARRVFGHHALFEGVTKDR